MTFIHRKIEHQIEEYREIFPVIAILGPRQSGKSTLIKHISKIWDNYLYLDLQDMEDLNKLNDPKLFFTANQEKIICIDEIQLKPELFAVLRSIIDQNRVNGKFIVLGSASRDLIQQSSETLAGRIAYIHLTPFLINELEKESKFELKKFWLRGGFPESFLAKKDGSSFIWLKNFIQTYVERDLPQLGINTSAQNMRRFLMMCCHAHGQQLNLSKLAESMALTHPTIKNYIDILEQTFLLRVLAPYELNLKKRIVKTPKLLIRDSGILHALLQINSFNDLMGNPIFGSSWEGLVIENVVSNFPDWQNYFFRTSKGDKVDLLLIKGNKKVVIECKASTAPKLTKGFYRSLDLIQPDHCLVVAPLTSTPYQLTNSIQVVDLITAIREIEKL